jgi:transcription antitermination factor NusG
MFPGYVFARFDYELRTDILSTPGLQRAGLLTFCGEPAIVSDEQIEEIKAIEAHGVVPSPFREGQPIEIVMDNGLRLTGKLVRDDSETFVVVEYKMLGKAFRISRDRALVKAA